MNGFVFCRNIQEVCERMKVIDLIEDILNAQTIIRLAQRGWCKDNRKRDRMGNDVVSRLNKRIVTLREFDEFSDLKGKKKCNTKIRKVCRIVCDYLVDCVRAIKY
jgi:hypothetical protein